jgi:beta-lactamase class A
MTGHCTNERWRPVAVAALLLLAVAAPAQARPPAGWGPDTHAARLYAAQRPGRIAFAVRTEQRFWGRHADTTFPSASVLKAMLLVAYLREPYVRGRALRHSERALLTPMIRRSDNDAATAIRARIGNGALVHLAHVVGMKRFRPAAIWGLSRIDARDQTLFFLRIDRLLPPRHRAYGLRLLRTVVPWQRWGVGRVAPAGWELYFKGGWGSGTGLVDHQVALLRRGDERVAIAVLTVADGSHAAGKVTLKGIFARLLKGLAGAG